MKAIADLHSHSTYSDGRGTVTENIRAAAAIGLERYAITDHGPQNIGVGVGDENKYLVIKEEVRGLRESFPDLQVLVGAEADIISLEGDIDLSRETIEALELLIVGLHPYVWPKTWKDGWDFVLSNQTLRVTRSMEEKVRCRNTKALVEAMARYPVDIVSHPNLEMPVEIREVARACHKYGSAYEINTGHNFQTIEDVLTAAKEGVTFVVNSDAHFPESIGRLDIGIELLERAGVSPEQTLNLKAEQ
ncbi:MAG: PHP domain-containing protein [Firmicutes bacterium]|nr:PHP domain-containing protein [Bacillota bacterium]